MTDFINSYHFVDSGEPETPEGWRADVQNVDVRNFGLTDDTAIDGHAVYAADGKSGRIICTLKLENPTVLGGKREGQDPAFVLPYLFQNKPALPATSIKGSCHQFWRPQAGRGIDNCKIAILLWLTEVPRKFGTEEVQLIRVQRSALSMLTLKTNSHLMALQG